MGTGTKVVSVLLRFFELCSAAVVAGIVGNFIHLVNKGDGHVNSKLLFTISLAGISLFFSIVLLFPARWTFWAFALDCAIFIMWMVSFGLLEDLGGGHTCSAYWQWNYWGYYWGGFYTYPNNVTSSIVNSAGCNQWRATLAFIFLGGIAWLLSCALGVIAVASGRDERKEGLTKVNKQPQVMAESTV
ncbi:hypothetical protein HYFRA_00010870 [Hymenoscyphus fraxineus]|uniref:MARVEL domain-containing protein n=1 Tax=Hymenoscyphus fraxineus TaxID=746836 RepID=A0A9N9KU21_9HELO|nr:hypothetical protein HYFRA_00010870 [Hymenoscyphus fraxineus]